MAFKTLASEDFVQKEALLKRFEFLQSNGPDPQFYLSLRQFFNKDGKYIPSKSGICLTTKEVLEIFPKLEKLEEFQIGDRRVVRMSKVPDLIRPIYQLDLTKSNGNYQAFGFNEEELIKFCEYKESILKFCTPKD